MSTTSAHLESTSANRIAPDTSLGPVRLTVSELDRSRVFYEQAVGLRAVEHDDGALGFGAPGGRVLIELRGDAAAPRLNRRAPGLYHLAILVPTRRDLAFALARLVQAGWPLDGASDHMVSEALYLSDPDGNGIEIYRDRPREEWRRVGDQLQMATLPLDLDAVLAELRGELRVGHGNPHHDRDEHSRPRHPGRLRPGLDRGDPGRHARGRGRRRLRAGVRREHHLRTPTAARSRCSAPVPGTSTRRSRSGTAPSRWPSRACLPGLGT